MECTRTLSHTYATSSGLVRPQRATLRHLARPSVVSRPRLAAVPPAAVASFPASGAASNAGFPTAPPTGEVTRVTDIASAEAFREVQEANPSKLVILMCKATGCRPCKQFRPKYVRLADHYRDAVFCEIIGDRNDSTRSLMRDLKIRATPTFVFFRNGEEVHSHSGINPQKMIDALKVAVLPEEAGFCEEVKFAVDLLNH